MVEQEPTSTSTGAVQDGDAATAPDIQYSFTLFDQITGFDRYILHLCYFTTASTLIEYIQGLGTYHCTIEERMDRTRGKWTILPPFLSHFKPWVHTNSVG